MSRGSRGPSGCSCGTSTTCAPALGDPNLDPRAYSEADPASARLAEPNGRDGHLTRDRHPIGATGVSNDPSRAESEAAMQSALERLAEMGFTDAAAATRALDASGGDVGGAVAALVQ